MASAWLRMSANVTTAGLTTLTAPAVRYRPRQGIWSVITCHYTGLCPSTTAWVDKARSNGRAHGDMECGNVGIYNRNDVLTRRANR